MKIHAAIEHDAVTDNDHGWAIYACGHGCLHVALDRVMVTLTADEFHALQELMHRAAHRFLLAEAQPENHARAN